MLVVLDIYCKDISLGLLPAGCIKATRTYICLQGHNAADWPSFLIPVNLATLDLINLKLGKAVRIPVRSGKSLLVPTAEGDDIAISMSLLQELGDGFFKSICCAVTSVNDLAQKAVVNRLALDERLLQATDFAGNKLADFSVLLKAEVTSESVQPFLAQQLQQQKSLQMLATMVQTKLELTAGERAHLLQTLLHNGATSRSHVDRTRGALQADGTRSLAEMPRSTGVGIHSDGGSFRPPLVGFEQTAARTIYVTSQPPNRGDEGNSLRLDEYVSEKLSSALSSARIPRDCPTDVPPLYSAPEHSEMHVPGVEDVKPQLHVGPASSQLPLPDTAPVEDAATHSVASHQHSFTTAFKPLSRALRAKIAAANEQQRLLRRTAVRAPRTGGGLLDGVRNPGPVALHELTAAPLNETEIPPAEYSSIRRSGQSDSLLSAPLASNSPTIEANENSLFVVSQSNSLFTSGMLPTTPRGMNKLKQLDVTGRVSAESTGVHGTTDLSAISGVSSAGLHRISMNSSIPVEVGASISSDLARTKLPPELILGFVIGGLSVLAMIVLMLLCIFCPSLLNRGVDPTKPMVTAGLASEQKYKESLKTVTAVPSHRSVFEIFESEERAAGRVDEEGRVVPPSPPVIVSVATPTDTDVNTTDSSRAYDAVPHAPTPHHRRRDSLSAIDTMSRLPTP